MARNAMPPKGLPPKGRRGAVAPGKGKGKALVPPMKGGARQKSGGGTGAGKIPTLRTPPPASFGAALPPPRPVRGRVAVAVPVFPMGPPGRRMGPPPPGRGMPPRLTPPGPPRPPMAPEPPPPSAGRAAVMQQRGAPAMMARLRRGKVAF
jgi:hypothetical protein